jgi:hypothetical protein
MAIKGTTKTEAPFKLKNKLVAKAATIIDHQGKNCERISAITIVAIKLMLFFVMIMGLKFVLK